MSENSPALSGPERRTICESIIGDKVIPYNIRILIPAIFLGYTSSNFGDRLLTWFLWALLVYWMFYAIRFIRTRIMLAEKHIAPLCPEEEKGFHQVFHGLTEPLPQILTILIVTPFVAVYFSRLFAPPDPLYQVLAVANFVLGSFVWGSVVWLYFRSLKGLYDLGRQPLRLKSYYEDAILGVRPFGTLSLSLALAFLALTSLGSIATYFYANSFTTAFIVVFAVMGIVMFFVPLYSVHQRMIDAKEKASSKVSKALNEFLEASGKASKAKDEPLHRIEKILTLEFEERKVNSIHTWPFDSEIVGKFTIIVLSVLSILLGQLFVVILGIR